MGEGQGRGFNPSREAGTLDGHLLSYLMKAEGSKRPRAAQMALAWVLPLRPMMLEGRELQETPQRLLGYLPRVRPCAVRALRSVPALSELCGLCIFVSSRLNVTWTPCRAVGPTPTLGEGSALHPESLDRLAPIQISFFGNLSPAQTTFDSWLTKEGQLVALSFPFRLSPRPW